jgi:hypothetical protein
MKHLLLACFLVLGCPAIHAAAPDSVLSNGGFENGIAGWGIYVPDESKVSNCRFDVVGDKPHSGANCARFQSDDFGRFSVGCPLIPVQAGERYHVSVWVRAEPATLVRSGAPGFVIRLYLGQANADAAGGHLFIGPGNRVARNTPADPVAETLPTTWTRIEAVVEIPSGVDSMGAGLFSWWTKGALFADDFSIEKVDASTTVTPLWQKNVSPTPAPASK